MSIPRLMSNLVIDVDNVKSLFRGEELNQITKGIVKKTIWSIPLLVKVTDSEEVNKAINFELGSYIDGYEITGYFLKPSPKDNQKYILTLTHSPPSFGGGGRNSEANKGEIRVQVWFREEEAEYDTLTGLPIVNTAGDKYKNPPKDSIPQPLYVLKTVTTSSDDSLYDLIGSVNDSAITIFGKTIPQHAGMLENITESPFYDSEGNLSFVVEARIQVNNKKDKSGAFIGWAHEVRNVGLEAIRDDGNKGRIFDRLTRQFFSVAQDLGLLGKVLGVGEDVVYNTHMTRQVESFSALPFSSSYPYKNSITVV